MEIIKESKPDNEIEYIDSIIFESSFSWTTIISEGDKVTIFGKERPNNIVEITDEITLLEQVRPDNEIINRDSIKIITTYEQITEPSESDKFTILKKDRHNNIIEIYDEIE